MIHTIIATKEFLDAELVKHPWKTFEHLFKGLYESKRGFETAKGMGIGRENLVKFLGGNWKQWMVQEALVFIADYKTYLDKDAVETNSRL